MGGGGVKSLHAPILGGGCVLVRRAMPPPSLHSLPPPPPPPPPSPHCTHCPPYNSHSRDQRTVPRTSLLKQASTQTTLNWLCLIRYVALEGSTKLLDSLRELPLETLVYYYLAHFRGSRLCLVWSISISGVHSCLGGAGFV